MVIKKLYCPLCGREMIADLHAPVDGAEWSSPPNQSVVELRDMDNWMCYCDAETVQVVITRKDLREMILEE